MRLITLKSYLADKGFILYATIDQIPEDKNLSVIAAMQRAIYEIMLNHS